MVAAVVARGTPTNYGSPSKEYEYRGQSTPSESESDLWGLGACARRAKNGGKYMSSIFSSGLVGVNTIIIIINSFNF